MPYVAPKSDRPFQPDGIIQAAPVRAAVGERFARLDERAIKKNVRNQMAAIVVRQAFPRTADARIDPKEMNFITNSARGLRRRDGGPCLLLCILIDEITCQAQKRTSERLDEGFCCCNTLGAPLHRSP